MIILVVLSFGWLYCMFWLWMAHRGVNYVRHQYEEKHQFLMEYQKDITELQDWKEDNFGKPPSLKQRTEHNELVLKCAGSYMLYRLAYGEKAFDDGFDDLISEVEDWSI